MPIKLPSREDRTWRRWPGAIPRRLVRCPTKSESIFHGDPELVRDGRVTKQGLVDLRERMPFADLSTFEKNPEVSALGDLFTVDLVVRYIRAKLGQPCRE
jgi:hypothetical protein